MTDWEFYKWNMQDVDFNGCLMLILVITISILLIGWWTLPLFLFMLYLNKVG